MSKDDKRRGSKDERLDVSKKAVLAHNPFAALAGAVPVAEKPATTTPEEPAPRATEAPAPKLGRLTLRRETKRRGGKAVVVVTGFGSTSPLDRSAVDALASELKRVLGCGGTVEANGTELEIVVQGDQPARVAELLRSRGFRVGGVTG